MIALPIYKHLAGMDPADLSKVNLSGSSPNLGKRYCAVVASGLFGE